MQTYKLVDMASVIRSKNSGPYELTFDVIFAFEDYNFFKEHQPITPEVVAKLYGIAVEDVLQVIYFDPAAKAVKATDARPIPSGTLGETDVPMVRTAACTTCKVCIQCIVSTIAKPKESRNTGSQHNIMPPRQGTSP